MDIQLINTDLIKTLHEEACSCERKRMHFDLRTTPNDQSQRMINALEVGTRIPIHRHLDTTETVVCIEGCIEEIFYTELPNQDAGGPTHDGEYVLEPSCFKEIARIKICPREGLYGIQIPQAAWHTIEVLEPSTIFEAKDGTYEK